MVHGGGMLLTALSNQYGKGFAMLAETIGNYDDALWFDDKNYRSPAWRIAAGIPHQ
jgi:hypothetical protein